jgi:hypothetical protein
MVGLTQINQLKIIKEVTKTILQEHKMGLLEDISKLFGKKKTKPPIKTVDPVVTMPIVVPKPVIPAPVGKVQKGKNKIPFAVQSPLVMRTRGKYDKGYPYGAIVHFTSGRYEGGIHKALDTIQGGVKNGFAFLCIAVKGELVQAHPVTEWGYHAGESAWKNPSFARRLVGSVSDDLIGIEINNAGRLEKTKDGRFKTWFGTYIPADQVRHVSASDYGTVEGYYHKYTAEQEKTLTNTLLWLKANDPVGCFDFDLVLGHDEVAGKLGIGYFRKNDPGGSLSMSMPQYRAYLKNLWGRGIQSI